MALVSSWSLISSRGMCVTAAGTVLAGRVGGAASAAFPVGPTGCLLAFLHAHHNGAVHAKASRKGRARGGSGMPACARGADEATCHAQSRAACPTLAQRCSRPPYQSTTHRMHQMQRRQRTSVARQLPRFAALQRATQSKVGHLHAGAPGHGAGGAAGRHTALHARHGLTSWACCMPCGGRGSWAGALGREAPWAPQPQRH